MEQTVVNWLLAGFGALIGFLLKSIWQAVKELQGELTHQSRTQAAPKSHLSRT